MSSQNRRICCDYCGVASKRYGLVGSTEARETLRTQLAELGWTSGGPAPAPRQRRDLCPACSAADCNAVEPRK